MSSYSQRSGFSVDVDLAGQEYTQRSGFSTDITLLEDPTNLRIVDDTVENEIEITWDETATATGYYVYRAESAFESPNEATQVVDVAGPSYTDTDIEDGEQYFYRVSAYN